MNLDDNDRSTSTEPNSISDDEQLSLLRIKETRDSLLMQKDNHVTFTNLDDPF